MSHRFKVGDKVILYRATDGMGQEFSKSIFRYRNLESFFNKQAIIITCNVDGMFGVNFYTIKIGKRTVAVWETEIRLYPKDWWDIWS